MRLVQLNIWGGKLEYQLADFLEKTQPDIICMQEVHDLKGQSGALFATLDELQTKGGFTHRFMSPTYTSQYQKRQLHFGNAILSKLPFLHTTTTFTYGAYNSNFDLTEDDFNARNFQHVSIDNVGKPLHIFNHHGYLVMGSKQGNPETYRQMQLLDQAIAAIQNEAVLVTGDFNLAPSSESIRLLTKRLHNLPVEHNLVSTYTQFNTNNVVCDYIFANDFITVEHFEALDDLVSDHKPLLLNFSI